MYLYIFHCLFPFHFLIPSVCLLLPLNFPFLFPSVSLPCYIPLFSLHFTLLLLFLFHLTFPIPFTCFLFSYPLPFFFIFSVTFLFPFSFPLPLPFKTPYLSSFPFHSFLCACFPCSPHFHFAPLPPSPNLNASPFPSLPFHFPLQLLFPSSMPLFPYLYASSSAFLSFFLLIHENRPKLG